jgi:glucose-6-phosphate 1-epimerase
MKLPSSVRLETGRGELPKYVVENENGRAEIYSNGAHVTSFTPRGAEHDLLWLSQESHWQEGKPIRGGVPLCFPWFGPKEGDPDAPAHGVARTGQWELKEMHEAEASTSLVFVPSQEVASNLFWPRGCQVEFTVDVGEALGMSFAVENVSGEEIAYEVALHTYFSVGDARQVLVRGLEGVGFFDKVAGSEREGENEAVHFTAETDRVYQSASTCALDDPLWNHSIAILKQNSNSTVVWNPWVKKSAVMPDFGDAEWTRMACIETANVGANRVVLKPRESHETVAIISLAG